MTLWQRFVAWGVMSQLRHWLHWAWGWPPLPQIPAPAVTLKLMDRDERHTLMVKGLRTSVPRPRVIEHAGQRFVQVRAQGVTYIYRAES